MNTHLTEVDFWLDVEAGDLLSRIAELEALATHTDKQQKLLNKLRTRLNQAKAEAERLASLNRKWQDGKEGEVKPQVVIPPDADWAENLFPIEPKDPNKTYCSFCGTEVDAINSIRGTGKPNIRIIREDILIDGEYKSFERMTAQVPKVTSCSKCQAQVRKPVVISVV